MLNLYAFLLANIWVVSLWFIAISKLKVKISMEKEHWFMYLTKEKQLLLFLNKNMSVVYYIMLRSSRRRCSVKTDVLKNFTKSQQNICVRDTFLIKLQALGLRLY